MNFIVLKFGGTSVSTRKNWDNIVTIVEKHCSEGLRPIIVCSAITKASNLLEHMLKLAISESYEYLYDELVMQYNAIAHDLNVAQTLIQDDLSQLKQWLTGVALLKEATPKTCAQVMSLGELMLTKLGHAFLAANGIKISWVDARKVIVSSEDHSQNDVGKYLSANCYDYTNAQANNRDISLLLDDNYDVIITQGFIASNNEGDTVLLGRGGSDTTASILAAMTDALRCEIWTDVPGIYTANPHQLPHARLLKQINYDEAQEIASMGGKVFHPNFLMDINYL